MTAEQIATDTGFHRGKLRRAGIPGSPGRPHYPSTTSTARSWPSSDGMGSARRRSRRSTAAR
jgi:hypothetical protein